MLILWLQFILCSAVIVLCGTMLSRYGDVIAEKTGLFNLSIIALMDILHGRKPIFSESEHGHILSAGFGIILISIAAISILAGQNWGEERVSF